MFNKLKKLFHKEERPDLRTMCVKMYGEEFGKIYDDMNCGIPVGGFMETAAYISKIEEVRKNFKCK